jgi:Tol biopolymer transport system component
MRRAVLAVAFHVILGITSPCCSREAEIVRDPQALTTLSGAYMGLERPGVVPALFAPGVVSTGQDELNGSFTPDGKEFYFSVGNPLRSYYAVVGMRDVGGRWTRPEVVPFSGRFSDADPLVTADGKRLYFVSRRPTAAGAAAEKDWDIWFVERDADGWGEPQNVGEPVNTHRNEMYVSVSRQGTLYFHSNRDDTHGEMDIYRAPFIDGRHGEPENLGAAVNSRFNEWDPMVAPDESYVIYTSSGRPDDLGRGDMYISFRGPDGEWMPARNIGPEINSTAFDYCPVLSPDGRYLFFSSYRAAVMSSPNARRTLSELAALFSRPRNGLGDIYWVDASVIERLRPR